MVPVDIQIKGAIAGVVALILIVALLLERHRKISNFLNRLIDFLTDSLRGF